MNLHFVFKTSICKGATRNDYSLNSILYKLDSFYAAQDYITTYIIRAHNMAIKATYS